MGTQKELSQCFEHSNHMFKFINKLIRLENKISQQIHMLNTYVVGTLKNSLNENFIEHPKHKFKLLGKKIIILR